MHSSKLLVRTYTFSILHADARGDKLRRLFTLCHMLYYKRTCGNRLLLRWSLSIDTRPADIAIHQPAGVVIHQPAGVAICLHVS